MAFPTKKLISLLIAIVSAATPVIYSLVNNSLPNLQDLKVSFFFNQNDSSTQSSLRKKRDTSSKQYEKELQAKIEQALFGKSSSDEESIRKDNSRKVIEKLKKHALKLEDPVPTKLDAVCTLTDTRNKKKMFQCSGPKKGPLSSMFFEFSGKK